MIRSPLEQQQKKKVIIAFNGHIYLVPSELYYCGEITVERGLSSALGVSIMQTREKTAWGTIMDITRLGIPDS